MEQQKIVVSFGKERKKKTRDSYILSDVGFDINARAALDIKRTVA